MDCCQCKGIEDLFNEKSVAKELSNYRQKGPDKTTRWLLQALKMEGVEDASLLDIGGGVGAIQHELLAAGAASAVDVDASPAYISAAAQEAQRRGLADRVTFQHGNFVDIADELPPADIVTLDRVICCYHDMEKLVDRSAARARKLYGVVYPRDRWWARLAVSALNLIFRLQSSHFRTYVHPTHAVETQINRHGFKRKFYRSTLVWQVVVYSR